MFDSLSTLLATALHSTKTCIINIVSLYVSIDLKTNQCGSRATPCLRRRKSLLSCHHSHLISLFTVGLKCYDVILLLTYQMQNCYHDVTILLSDAYLWGVPLNALWHRFYVSDSHWLQRYFGDLRCGLVRIKISFLSPKGVWGADLHLQRSRWCTKN